VAELACRTTVCLTQETLDAVNAIFFAKKLQLKVMSDNTATVYINGAEVYMDPVDNHDPT
jgi:hypothetical protein